MLRTIPQLGAYTELELVGRGAMGSVYRAHDARHDRPVAVKVLDPVIASGVASDRFIRETRFAAGLIHPHILPVFDSGEDAGCLYYVMPYVEGPSLAEMIESQGPFAPGEVCRIGAELADALDYAHRQGVLHRDIKPANILLAAGQPVLADFGLARALKQDVSRNLTEHNWVVGTPRYMSPEQGIAGYDLDGRSDIYALGLTLKDALSGSDGTPRAASRSSGRRPGLSDRLRRPAHRRLARVLARATEPDPDDRYRSAAEFARALRKCAGPTVALPWLAVGVSATVLLLGLAGLGAYTTRTAPLSATRVAVTSLENRTGRSDLDAFGAMAADWITQGIQQNAVLEVLPTPSVRSAERHAASVGARRQPDPIRELAHSTGAGLIVSGAFYLQGDSLRIHLQLYDARRDAVAGGLEPIYAPVATPTEALDEARSRVMSLLARRVDPRVASAPGTSTQPPLFEAYQHFVLGLDAYSQTRWTDAQRHFEAARRADTLFVQAHLYEAIALSNLGLYPAADTLLHQANRRRAFLSDYDRDWLDYRIAFLEGRPADALRAIRRAADRAPLSKASYNLAVEAMEQGQLGEALAALARLEANRGPMYGFLPYQAAVAVVQHLLGQHRAELKTIREMLELYPDQAWPRSLEILALAGMGRGGAVLARLEEYALDFGAGQSPSTLAVARRAADELRVHGEARAARAVLEWAVAWSERLPRGAVGGTLPEREQVEILRRLGRWTEARVAIRVLRASEPADIELLVLDAVLATASGDMSRHRALRDSVARVEGPYLFGLPQYGLARIAAVAGERDAALVQLRAAIAAGWPLGAALHREFDFATLLEDPEFERLAAPWRSPSGRR